MIVPYLLRFCPFRALMGMLFGIHTQGVASLALGYVLLGFQPALPKSETLVSYYLFLDIH